MLHQHKLSCPWVDLLTYQMRMALNVTGRCWWTNNLVLAHACTCTKLPENCALRSCGLKVYEVEADPQQNMFLYNYYLPLNSKVVKGCDNCNN